MGIDIVQTNPGQVTEASKITFTNGLTFFSQIPFHLIEVNIFKDGKIISKTNFEVGAKCNFTLDVSFTTEIQVLVYQIISNAKKMVGAIRGNASDLFQQRKIELAYRML